MTENIFISPREFYFPVCVPLSMGIGGDIYKLMDKAEALNKAVSAIRENFGGKRYNCFWAVYRDGNFEAQGKEFKNLCNNMGIPTREHYEVVRSLSDLTNEEIKKANRSLGNVEDLFLDGSACISDACFSAHGFSENIREKALELLQWGKITEQEYVRFRDLGLMIAQEFKAEAMRKWLRLYDAGATVF